MLIVRVLCLIIQGGHDGHSLSKANLQNNLPGINQGITAFYEEMVATDMLDAVTFVMISEFGRTSKCHTNVGHSVPFDRSSSLDFLHSI